MRFLGFGLSDRVPDARTIWLVREKLTKAGAIGPLFERFDATLRQSGSIAMGGPDRRCAPDRRSSSAQHPGREEGDQGRPHPRRLERQAREAPPEGSRRALDSQIHQGQAVRASRARLDRRHLSIWRFRCSAIRTTSRSIAVSASFAKGIFNLTDANGARRTPQPMRAAVCAMDFSTRRQDQHGAQRLGGHRLQIGRQRGVHAKEPLRQPCPS